MPEVQKVSVALTGEQVSTLKGAVESGEYATTSEIVREALGDWQRKRDLHVEQLGRLWQLWSEGKQSGRASERTSIKCAGEPRSEQLARRVSTGLMPADLLWSPLALEDLLNIYVTIALNSAEAAERVYTASETRASSVSIYPRLGSRRPEIAPEPACWWKDPTCCFMNSSLIQMKAR